MTYSTASGLRMALDRRLATEAARTGVSLDRLRRRVIFERAVARLTVADPGQWVLKGGMALEVRLRDDARLTKDVDLGLRDPVASGPALHERLVTALTADPFGDRFVIAAGSATELSADGAGQVTWRSRVVADLAGKRFGTLQLDISPRPRELTVTDAMTLPNSLAFAGIPGTEVEVIDVSRHAAEKFHAMTRVLPASWRPRFEAQATAHGLRTTSFDDALDRVARLWPGP